MTRFNLIPPEELSDQHLIAEYHELLRIIRQDINTKDAPETFCLGKGHVKWAKKHTRFLAYRFFLLCNEMRFRNFKLNYSYDDLKDFIIETVKPENDNNYYPSNDDICLSRNRIIDKIKHKPTWYRWTKRLKPDYVLALN